MSKISGLCFAALFLALFLSGLQIVGEPVKIVPFDVVFVCIVLLTLPRLFVAGRIHAPEALRQCTALAYILFIWLILQALRSHDTGRAFTLLVIATRDIGIMILVAIMLINWHRNSETVAHIFFIAGSLVSTVVIPIFLLTIREPGRVVLDPAPGLIYRAGEGLVPHLQGLNHNPIYFATLSLLSAIAGLTIHPRQRSGKILKIAGLSVLFLAVLLSFQRGPLISLTLGILLTFLFVYFYPKTRSFFVRRLISMSLMIVLLALPVSFVRLQTYQTTLLERLMFRFVEANWQARMDRWSELLADYQDLLILIGHGLRSAELTLGAQVVESSYVDILYEQGVIGLMIWIGFWAYILLLGARKTRKDPAMSIWVLTWSTILLSMGYISMQYDPLTWVVAGLVVGYQGVPKTLSERLHGQHSSATWTIHSISKAISCQSPDDDNEGLAPR